MNIFRIGLNLIVVGVLYNIHTLFDYVWVLSAFLLGIATLAQHMLHDMTSGNKEEQAAALAEYQDLEQNDLDEEYSEGIEEKAEKDTTDGKGNAEGKEVEEAGLVVEEGKGRKKKVAMD